MAVAADAFFVAHGLGKGLAQGDANVFDRVVRVDLEIADRLYPQVEATVAATTVVAAVEKKSV